MKPLTLLSWLVFLGFATWVFTWSPEFVRDVRKIYFTAMKPFLVNGSKLKSFVADFEEEVEHSKVLERRLSEAEAVEGRLDLVQGRLDELEKENAVLRKALAFQENAPFRVFAAKVLPKQNERLRETLLIQKSQGAVLKANLPVLDTSGLVGRITADFDEELAEVLLLTDKSCQVSVRVEETNERGILIGAAKQVRATTPLLHLKHLSQNAELLPGMKVLTTGRGGVFPEGLLVGTIESVIPGSFESEAFVKSAVDFENLEVVFIPDGEPTETAMNAKE